ncbi:MAG: phosphodiester glycosidase family protein, partial [Patescibacteria group bacterium]
EDAAGHDYLIVTKKGSLSLYELAKWLDEQPENFVIAGNLDGGPSTGLSLENEKHDLEIPSGAVPSVIVGYRSE